MRIMGVPSVPHSAGLNAAPLMKSATYFSRFTSQWAGISPNHSTPESFIGALGSRPRVTARVMRAARFSWSSSISRSFFEATSAVKRRRLPVQELGNGPLLQERWEGNVQTGEVARIDGRITHSY